MHILLIEDNDDLVANLCDFLQQRGHVVDVARDGVTGLHLGTVNDYDVVVLDLALPGMDGIDVCRKLRGHAGKATPVLMLTARDQLEDKLEGFESGADDYLVKPFALAELDARLRAVTARASAGRGLRSLQVADLRLDLDTLQLERAGVRIALTRTELRIVELLMRESHRVVTRAELERTVWGDDLPDSDALRTHIHGLRNAIDKPFPVPLLHTVRGIGFRLCAPDGP